MSIDIKKALNLLNEYLSRKKELRRFVICGGASLVLRGIQERGTSDVDIIGPAIDKILKEVSLQVATDLGLAEGWLNDSAGRNFAKDLPDGWRERVIDLYSASHLMVQSLSNFDLAALKFLAECDRQKDFQDLLDLNLTELEVEKIVEHARRRDPGDMDHWNEVVDEVESRLRKKMGYEK